MEIYLLILSAVLGLCWGSFLTVVIWRIDDLKSIFQTRSRCTNCEAEISWYDLVPLISYGILRGRCRHCKQKISGVYPLIETLTAVIFVLLFLNYGISWMALLLVFVFSSLVVNLGYDAVHMLIVDQFVWIGVILTALYQILNITDWTDWKTIGINIGLGILIGVAIPAILVFIGRGKWMGEGDISLGLLAGLLVGYPNILVAYILAFIIGSLYGITVIILKRNNIKDAVPFGPFLVLGTTAAFFAGDTIINWYANLSFFNF